MTCWSHGPLQPAESSTDTRSNTGSSTGRHGPAPSCGRSPPAISTPARPPAPPTSTGSRTANQGGASEWTAPVNGVWFQGAAPPKRIFVQTLGQWLFVSWNNSVTPGVTAHEMRYRVDGGEWTQATMTKRYHLADWSTGDTLHEYSMRALIDDQPGDWSPIKQVTIALPAAVPNVTANRESANGVRLHWENTQQRSSGILPDTSPPGRRRLPLHGLRRRIR